MTPLSSKRRILPLLLVAFLAVALIACGGSSDSGEDSSSGAPSDGSLSSTAGGGGASNDRVPDDDGEASDEESVLLAALDDADFELPDDLPTGADALLGGTPYYAAAAAVTASLEAAGLAIAGLEIHVLPISGTDTSLLVFEMDTAAMTSETEAVPEDATPALTTLLQSEAVQAANVSRVVLNFRGEDETGPVTFTITMPLETLGKMLDETITDQESEAQILIGVQRP
jgi:hypothetical protein